MIGPPSNSLLTLTVALAVLLFAMKGCGSSTASRPAAHYEPIHREIGPIAKHIRVESTREIAPHQTITILHIPDPLTGAAAFEERCIIYEHLEFRTSQIVCSSYR